MRIYFIYSNFNFKNKLIFNYLIANSASTSPLLLVNRAVIFPSLHSMAVPVKCPGHTLSPLMRLSLRSEPRNIG